MFGFPPKPMYRFHGRAGNLLQLERAFQRHPAVLLAGGGGMGKTALAREAAFWWLRTRRFDQAVFVSFERPTTTERVIQEIGKAFEGTRFASRSGEEQRRVAIDIFRQRRVLLVWDNFESTLPQFQQGESGGPVAYPETERLRLRDFYLELRNGAPQGRLLITCRPTESGLPAIKESSLWGLDRLDSLHLLHAIADVKDIDLEREGFSEQEIGKLLDVLGDHPLSLSLVGPHLKSLKPAEIRENFASLLDRFKDDSADVERNRSLLASLAFSTSRLSLAARQVLPWLTWFQGGAFENLVLGFTKLAPYAWSSIRSELEATALLRVEQLEEFNVPFLRFHPTLPYAACRQEVGNVEAAEQHFVAVYLAAGKEVDTALWGSAAAAGMALMEREEANLRSALEIAFRRSERRLGCLLAETLRLYLQRKARLRERDELVNWLHAQMHAVGLLNAETWSARSQQALSLAENGNAEEAVNLLQQLIVQLKVEGLAGCDDPTYELGTSNGFLGRIFVIAERPDLALAPLHEAVEILEKLPGEAAQANLCAALGELATAYGAVGRLREAMASAERGLAINRQAGRLRSVAVGLDRIARTFHVQQLWAEAEVRYAEAIELARRIGDLELQSAFLQHQGALHFERGDAARAAELYEEAISFLQKAGDARGEMKTCDLLASAQLELGRLEAAEAWYQRSRELAMQLNDQYQLSVIAQNVGVLSQKRAEQALDAESRASWLRRAVSSIDESLAITLERKDQAGAAASYFQLGVLFQMLGDLTTAEKNVLCSLKITKELDDPNIFKVYHNLAEIAAARGDAAAAAAWASTRDTKLADLEQLRGGLSD